MSASKLMSTPVRRRAGWARWFETWLTSIGAVMMLDEPSIATPPSGQCPECLHDGRARQLDAIAAACSALPDTLSADRWRSGWVPVSTDVLARALDLMDQGVLLLAAGTRVVYLNQAARAELADSNHPLLLQGHELHVRQSEDRTAMRLALARACDKDLQRMLSIGGQGCTRTVVSILPMPKLGPNEVTGAMVVLTRGSQWTELTVAAFSRSHSLTRAEVRVLTQLCAGLRPTEVAHAHNVAVSTVRSQIRSLLSKTGVSSVAELVRQVSRLPPMPPRSALAGAPCLAIGH